MREKSFIQILKYDERHCFLPFANALVVSKANSLTKSQLVSESLKKSGDEFL
jgi:hypothetical protein